MTQLECKVCNQKFSWISNTHLKKHNLTCKEYLELYPDAVLKSTELKFAQGKSLRGKTYVEVYGEENTKNLIHKRSLDAQKQFEDFKQRNLRSEALTGIIRSEATKKKSSLTKDKNYSTYRKKALEHYGEKCQRCGYDPSKDAKKIKLIVHHKDEFHVFGRFANNNLDNLEVLCNSCHAKHHNNTNPGHFRGISQLQKGLCYLGMYYSNYFNFDFNSKNINFSELTEYISKYFNDIVNKSK